MTHDPAPGAQPPPLPGQPAPAAPPIPPPAQALRPEHFPTTTTRDGRIAWAFGLLGLISFPGLAVIAMSITMLILGLAQRGKNPVARAVGRRAAIFGAVSLLAAIVFFVLLFAVWPALQSAGIVTDDSVAMGVVLVPLAAWTAFIGPITGIVMGIVALAKPVSREKAERIYAGASR